MNVGFLGSLRRPINDILEPLFNGNRHFTFSRTLDLTIDKTLHITNYNCIGGDVSLGKAAWHADVPRSTFGRIYSRGRFRWFLVASIE